MWSYKKFRMFSGIRLANILLRILKRLTRLFTLEADNLSCELPVHIESFHPGYRMFPNNRVDVLHRISTYHTPSLPRSRKLSLLHTRMNRFERAQESHEWRRQFTQGGDLGCEESVSTGGWLTKKEEGGETGWLEFVGDVRVPDGRCDAVRVFEIERSVFVSDNEYHSSVDCNFE